MNNSKIQELSLLLAELEKRKSGRKIDQYFPDHGPLRRELYKKHVEFFNAGKDNRQRLFLAANRCITPWTFIETPDGPVPSSTVLFGKDRYVQSWDGESQCVQLVSGGFLKALEPAYRFVLEDQSFFDCTASHRLLTERGWIEANQLMLLSSGLRSTDTASGYQANCEKYGYLGDQQLPWVSSIDQVQLPLQDGALKHTLTFSLEDAMERTLQRIPTERLAVAELVPLELSLLEGLFELFSASASSQPSLQLNDHIQSAVQSDAGSSLALALKRFVDNRTLCEQEVSALYLDVVRRFEAFRNQFPMFEQSLSVVFPGHSLQQLHRDVENISIFYPFSHTPLVGGKRIYAIVPIGYQPIIDGTVENTHNYKAAGVFHHNTGKSLAGAYEFVCHVSGIYPSWWQGKRFTSPNNWFVVSDTTETSRQIMQQMLLGPVGEFGTGMIPRDSLDFDSLTDAKKSSTGVSTFRVKFNTGGYSIIHFKSSEQGRKAFQGVECNVYIDEECPQPVYEECLLRTMTNDHILIATFTPLKGMTPMVESFMEDGDPHTEGQVSDSKYVVRATWDDAPHLQEKDKKEMLESIAPFQRDARSKGIPQLGAGAIFPIEPSSYTIAPFEIPKHWKKGYGFDVGRNTAAIWIAENPDDKVLYAYSEMFLVEGNVGQHIEQIQLRGKWISGAIDTAARGRSQTDGENLFQLYSEGGLKIVNAVKAVEAGLYEMLELFTQGRLKIFSTCSGLLKEMQQYSRDEHGKIIKKNDHRMDAFRYSIFTRDQILSTEAVKKAYQQYRSNSFSG